MIFDNRRYELQPGRRRELFVPSKKKLPVQTKHLGNLVRFVTAEIGDVNGADLADRTKRRATLAADPE